MNEFELMTEKEINKIIELLRNYRQGLIDGFNLHKQDIEREIKFYDGKIMQAESQLLKIKEGVKNG